MSPKQGVSFEWCISSMMLSDINVCGDLHLLSQLCLEVGIRTLMYCCEVSDAC